MSDGVTFNAPTIGLSLGWLLFVWVVVGFLLGKIHSNAAWVAREKDFVAERARMEAEHAREIERVEHDRQEWRTESRIKDAQAVEKDTQIRELQKQISAFEPLAGTVEQVMLAVHELAGRGLEEKP